MATRKVLAELISRYRSATAHQVTMEAAGGVDVAMRVGDGEPVDVVILASDAIDRLIAAGKLLAGSRVDLMKSGIALAVRAGRAKPDISAEGAVRAAVLAAKNVSFSTGPSGVYLEKMFGRWGILDDIRSRIVVPPPGMPVGSLIAAGAVDLGFQQLSELMGLPGIEIVGSLPPAIQNITMFCGGVGAATVKPDAARALLEYMASPDASSVKRRHGMESA